MNHRSPATTRPLRPSRGDPARTRALVRQVLRPSAGDPSWSPAVAAPAPDAVDAPAPDLAAARRTRLAWMDVLRGLAIVLVVLTHVRALGWRLHGIDDPLLGVLVDSVAPVRIPLLMLLSGMLLRRSLVKGPRPFVVGKLRGIAWPYVVWSSIYLAAWWLVPDLDGVAHTGQDLGDVVTEPVSVLWYLHLLLGLYLLALALHRVPGARPGHLLALAAVAWAASALGQSEHWERAACMAFFFLGGDVLSRRLDRPLPARATRTWASPVGRPLVVVALLALASPLLLWAVLTQPARYAPYSLVPAAAAMLLLAVGAHATRGSWLERPLAWIGRQSLVFYVAHWLVVALCFDVVASVVDPAARPWSAMTLVLVGTLVACALLARTQQHLSVLGWLFTAPRRRTAPRDRVQG